jgi:DNA-binding FadR family transcriptional regulator
MLRERISPENLSEFLRYLAHNGHHNDERLPALTELSQELGVSVASLQEQLEVARVLGVVEVRPRTGMRRRPYTFRPAVLQSLAYALAVNPDHFQAFSDLRSHVEAAYFHQAVSLLTADDLARLRDLIARAKQKLHGYPVQIPHGEHRELHLMIYQRLANPFVLGLLEAYWEMYEAVGLAVFADLAYLERVWQYHEKMVEALNKGDFDGGYLALREHFNLLSQRSQPASGQHFE